MNRRKFLKRFGGLLVVLPFVKLEQGGGIVSNLKALYLEWADTRMVATISLDEYARQLGHSLYMTNIRDGVVWRSDDDGFSWKVAE